VDPVPAIDRPHGAVTVTGTRIYSEALLSQLGENGAAKPKRRSRADDDGAVTALVNADVAWKDSDVAVIGDDSSGVGEWLLRRGVAVVEHHDLPSEKAEGKYDVVAWTSGFERCEPAALGERLETAAGMLRDDGALVLRVRTLGVTATGEHNGEPPLSELLFPAAAGESEVTAWDGATFSAWLASNGLQVTAERRVKRPRAELKALDRFRDKLGAIQDEELKTAAVDFTLERAPEPDGDESKESHEADEAEPEDRTDATDLLSLFPVVAAGDDVLEITGSDGDATTEISAEDVTLVTAQPEALAEGSVEGESCDVILCEQTLERIELERLDDASRELYRALRPGGHLLLGIGQQDARHATETTILVGLLRGGLEVVAAERRGDLSYFRLVRPLELPEIVRFSGINA
jgi:hypothetical protein